MQSCEIIRGVKTLAELRAQAERIAKLHPDKLLLFRGQTRHFEEVRSARARPQVSIPKAVEQGWRSLAAQMLGVQEDQGRNHGLVKAILQHYGMPTHYVDLTSDVEVAGWFAANRWVSCSRCYIGSSFRFYEAAQYQPQQGEGYILVLAFDSADDLRRGGRLFNLSELPDDFVRPHRQAGWLMLDRPPTEPEPNQQWIATIELSCSTFTPTVTQERLFPPPESDPAYASLLSLPFVQEPLSYKVSPKTEPVPVKTKTTEHEEFDTDSTACRALSIPEYVSGRDNESLNHKWEDCTLYEPHPVRLWRLWQFPLRSMYEGVVGDFKDTVKITLSPAAYDLMLRSVTEPCAWPELGSEGIFFSCAELDHDKLGEHGPKYCGVWLQRDDELVIEAPTESDRDVISVTPGHAYFLRKGRIERQKMRSACPCNEPETHDLRVGAALRLSALVEKNRIILLPHPTLSHLGLYVAITGLDSREVKHRASRFRRALLESSMKPHERRSPPPLEIE